MKVKRTFCNRYHVSEAIDDIPIMLSISYCALWTHNSSLIVVVNVQSKCHCVLTNSFCMADADEYLFHLSARISQDCVSYSYHKTYYGGPLYFMSISAQCCTYPPWHSARFSRPRLCDCEVIGTLGKRKGAKSDI